MSTDASMADIVTAVLRAHERNECFWHCDEGTTVSADWHAPHVAAAVIEALGLTEEQRTLTDGWIQPMRNIAFHIHGLTPPPGVITEESRLVSPWTETARMVE